MVTFPTPCAMPKSNEYISYTISGYIRLNLAYAMLPARPKNSA